MRLLLVSSEPLHPEDTLSSTFELSQAKLLSDRYPVAILSVAERPSTVSAARGLLGRVRRGETDHMLQEVRSICRRLRSKVRRHDIEGVPVFESMMSQGGGSFEGRLAGWTAAAWSAFDAYVELHGLPDLIHAHGRFLNAGAFALQVRKRTGVPYVYTEHSTFYMRGLAPNAARNVVREVLDGAAVYTAVGPALDDAVKQFVGDECRSAQIMPNALDPLFEAVPPKALSTPFNLIKVASLEEKKGIIPLIEAFGRAAKIAGPMTLTICGEGPLRAAAEQLAVVLNISEKVIFLGRLTKEKVLAAIDDASALVVASHIETFGVVAIEALSRGRPVITTRCGGPESFIGEGNGLIVAANDIDALSEAIVVMAANYQFYDSAAIRRDALATYGQAAFLERTSALYEAALKA